MSCRQPARSPRRSLAACRPSWRPAQPPSSRRSVPPSAHTHATPPSRTTHATSQAGNAGGAVSLHWRVRAGTAVHPRFCPRDQGQEHGADGGVDVVMRGREGGGGLALRTALEGGGVGEGGARARAGAGARRGVRERGGASTRGGEGERASTSGGKCERKPGGPWSRGGRADSAGCERERGGGRARVARRARAKTRARATDKSLSRPRHLLSPRDRSQGRRSPMASVGVVGPGASYRSEPVRPPFSPRRLPSSLPRPSVAQSVRRSVRPSLRLTRHPARTVRRRRVGPLQARVPRLSLPSGPQRSAPQHLDPASGGGNQKHEDPGSCDQDFGWHAKAALGACRFPAPRSRSPHKPLLSKPTTPSARLLPSFYQHA